VVYLNELRHISNIPLKLKVPLTRTDVPAVQAALGHIGIWEGKDYRGVEVLADVRPIPGTVWYMIAKIDKNEIFSVLPYSTTIIVIISLILILLFGFGMAWIYNNRQKNMYRKLLEQGNELQESQEQFRTTIYSIGDAVITTDLTGLIRNMNGIAETLTGWKESDALGKPIENVFHIINDDSREPLENPVRMVLKEGMVIGLAGHTSLISKDLTETPVANSGSPIKDETGKIIGVVLVFRDQSEERLSLKMLNIRLKLYEYSYSHTLKELLTKTLDEVGELTKSPIGFYHFMLPDQETLWLQAWSTKTEKEFCNAKGKGDIYKVSEAGVWVEAVHQRKPVIHNDYDSLPNKRGLPEGHAKVIRELVVPVIKNDQIVALLGIGNKPGNYTQKDMEVAAYISDVVWEIAEKKRAQELLSISEMSYRRLFESSKDGIIILNADTGMIEDVNPYLRFFLERKFGTWGHSMILLLTATIFLNYKKKTTSDTMVYPLKKQMEI
jgi:two-component system cell cycle sensor histidine kinase/response regulator CckA